MKKITHRQYLKKHKLTLANLPSDVQKKIGVFEKMIALEHTIEKQDIQELENRLTELDTEITADLKEVKQLHKEYAGDQKPVKTKNNNSHSPKMSHDEVIIKSLFDKGKRKRVMRGTLRGLGFKKKLGKVTEFGKYRIIRVSYCLYCYDIVQTA